MGRAIGRARYHCKWRHPLHQVLWHPLPVGSDVWRTFCEEAQSQTDGIRTAEEVWIQRRGAGELLGGLRPRRRIFHGQETEWSGGQVSGVGGDQHRHRRRGPTQQRGRNDVGGNGSGQPGALKVQPDAHPRAVHGNVCAALQFQLQRRAGTSAERVQFVLRVSEETGHRANVSGRCPAESVGDDSFRGFSSAGPRSVIASRSYPLACCWVWWWTEFQWGDVIPLLPLFFCLRAISQLWHHSWNH